MWIFKQLLARHIPEVYNHLEAQMFRVSMFASRWFMTLYTRDFPFEVLVRIWDIYLWEGPKILFRVALALVKLLKGQTLSLLLSLLSHQFNYQ